MRRAVCLALLAVVAVAAVPMVPRVATPARSRKIALAPHADAMATFYVATTGSDASGNGSSINPWATLDFARRQVEGVVKGGMTGDVYVLFAAGLYTLPATVEFTTLDSSTTAPYTIHYAANPANGDAPVVFSGAAQVPGPWTEVGGGSPAFTAYAGGASRQLYVNGLRASPPAFNASFMRARGNITEDGYVVHNDTSLLDWWAAQPVSPVTGAADPFEFVYTGVGSSWTEARCRVAALASDGAGGVLVSMEQPCWTNGRARGGKQNTYQAITFPASLENVAAALSAPGTGMLSLATQVGRGRDRRAAPHRCASRPAARPRRRCSTSRARVKT